jgi:septin family protein
MNNFKDFMVLAKLLISENFPNFYSVTSSYLESFRQVFDADALA